MKKITLLITALFSIMVGFSQTYSFDFVSPSSGKVGEQNVDVEITYTSDIPVKFQIQIATSDFSATAAFKRDDTVFPAGTDQTATITLNINSTSGNPPMPLDPDLDYFYSGRMYDSTTDGFPTMAGSFLVGNFGTDNPFDLLPGNSMKVVVPPSPTQAELGSTIPVTVEYTSDVSVKLQVSIFADGYPANQAGAFYNDPATYPAGENQQVVLMVPINEDNNGTPVDTDLNFQYNNRMFDASDDSALVEVFNGNSLAVAIDLVPQGTLSISDFKNEEFASYNTANSFELNTDQKISSVKVYNISGQVVATESSNDSSVSVSTDGLSSGVYLVEATTVNGTKGLFKIAK